MVSLLASFLESCGEGGCGEADGSATTWALIAVVALTVFFAIVQARRTTLRRGRAQRARERDDS